MRTRPIGRRLGVDTGGPNGADRFGNVVGSKPSGKNDRHADEIGDLAADPPIMRNLESADLPVRLAVAVKQQKLRDPVIEASQSDALPAGNRDAPNNEPARQF